MKLRSLLIVIMVVLFSSSLFAQGGAKQYPQGTVVGNSPPINQSSRLELLNQGQVWFDLTLYNKTAVLYMGNSPVYSFVVRVVNPVKARRRRARVMPREFVLTGNTLQRIIIDEREGVVFLKIKKRNRVTKLVISRISLERLPNDVLRYHLRDNAGLAFNINYHSGQLSSTFAFKGVPIFNMHTGYDTYQGRRNLNIVQFKGNTSGVLYYNRANQTFFFRSPRHKGSWSRARIIRR